VASASLGMRASELVRLYEQPSAANDEATSLHRHAISHDFFGHYELARQTYRKALALASDDIAIRNNLALSLTLSGAYGEAVREMSHVTASSRATAQHRHTLEMLLQLASQQESDAARRRAARDSWRETERTRRQAMTPAPSEPRPAAPAALDRIAPSSGNPAGNPHTGTVSADGGTADPVAWVVRTVSALWTMLNRAIAHPEPAADNRE